MANSYIDVNYTSPSTTLNFTNNDLEYLETAHLKIVVSNTSSGESVTFLQTDSTTFTVSVSTGTTTINFSSCVSSFPTGANKIRVQRVTPSDNLLTTFTNSSLLRAEDLNENSDQLLYVLQEQIDAGTGSLPLLATGQYDAGNQQIINLKDGADEAHAVSFGQLSALVSNATNSPSVAQNWEFNLGAGTAGTVADGHTSFTLSPAPASSVNATFIVEVAGVVQRPDSDFEINGNVLKVLDQALNHTDFNGTTIVAQNFGLARTVYDFPVTGEASSASETPITLKGYSGGDATALLKLKDSGNNENASISAGGTVKAKVIEPVTSGTLSVSATTLTTAGAITANGNLTVGDGFAVTETTGDTTVNKLTISETDTSGFTSTMAMPKSYVDASGGYAGNSVGGTDHLNTYMTPGNYRGTVPASPASYGYPAGVADGNVYTLIVLRSGSPTSNVIHQELIYRAASQKELRFERIHTANAQSGSEATEWGEWKKVINSGNGLNDLAAAYGDYSMGTQKIINHGTPTDATDVTNKSYVDAAIVADSETSGQVKLIGTKTFDNDDFFFSAADDENWHTKYRKIEIVYEYDTNNSYYRFGMGILRRSSELVYDNPANAANNFFNGPTDLYMSRSSVFRSGDSGPNIVEPWLTAFKSHQESTGGGTTNTYNTDGYVLLSPQICTSQDGGQIGSGQITIEFSGKDIMVDCSGMNNKKSTAGANGATAGRQQFYFNVDPAFPISRLSFASHFAHINNNRGTIYSGNLRIYGTFR